MSDRLLHLAVQPLPTMDKKRLKVRTVIVSDVHLGTTECKVREVNHFLRNGLIKTKQFGRICFDHQFNFFFTKPVFKHIADHHSHTFGRSGVVILAEVSR